MVPISNALDTPTSECNISKTSWNFQTQFVALERGDKGLQNKLNLIFLPQTPLPIALIQLFTQKNFGL